jgi:hypothetical protein
MKLNKEIVFNMLLLAIFAWLTIVLIDRVYFQLKGQPSRPLSENSN